jgi:hypothetical protein
LTAPLGPGAVALGAAAAAATAGVTNVAVQKGALSNKGFDWNKEVNKFELGTSVALSALPLGGIGSGAGKLALNTVGKNIATNTVRGQVTRAAIQYGAQGTVRGALIGGSVEAARQAANGEQINLGRIGASAVTGGVFGGVSGGALGAAGTKYALHKGTKLPQYGTFDEASATVGGGLKATGQAAKTTASAIGNVPKSAYDRVKNTLSSKGTGNATVEAAAVAGPAAPVTGGIDDFIGGAKLTPPPPLLQQHQL